jgi:multidrug efflux pump
MISATVLAVFFVPVFFVFVLSLLRTKRPAEEKGAGADVPPAPAADPRSR